MPHGCHLPPRGRRQSPLRLPPKFHARKFRCAIFTRILTAIHISLYALALSHLTGIPLFDFKCSWFNERQYCEFFPRTVLARKNTS